MVQFDDLLPVPLQHHLIQVVFFHALGQPGQSGHVVAALRLAGQGDDGPQQAQGAYLVAPRRPADGVQGLADQGLHGHRFQHQAQLSGLVVAPGVRDAPPGQQGQPRGQPVDAGHRGEGVVHPGRQGPEGGLGQQLGREGRVLALVALGSQGKGPVQGPGHARLQAFRRPHQGHGLPLGHELARAARNLDQQVPFCGQVHQALLVDHLQIAALVSPERCRPLLEALGQLGGPGIARLVVLLVHLLGIEPPDCPLQVAAHVGHEVVGLDGGGDVMDEVDQHRQAGQGQAHPHGDRQMGHLQMPAHALNGAQHDEAVDKGGHKGAQHQLVAGVVHEVAHQAGPELAGGQAEHHHGQGEDHPGHGDHGAGDGREHGPGTLGAAGVEPPEVREPKLGDDVVGPHRGQGQQRGRRGEQARHEPEAVAHRVPRLDQLAFHLTAALPAGVGLLAFGLMVQIIGPSGKRGQMGPSQKRQAHTLGAGPARTRRCLSVVGCVLDLVASFFHGVAHLVGGFLDLFAGLLHRLVDLLARFLGRAFALAAGQHQHRAQGYGQQDSFPYLH
eukprot:TRINITY_DN18770_c0_g2_i2.p1 TRINITY_DN18770_c0_g2~~TRINITY_DN18770_c0_g2_i2.p1  ORF type:complete len:557 (+),score=178.01 TRINITY_DN18770_c0_g2_i2:209-1879(+)